MATSRAQPPTRCCIHDDFYAPAHLCNFAKQDAHDARILHLRCRTEYPNNRFLSPRPATASQCPTRTFEPTFETNPAAPPYHRWRGERADAESELRSMAPAPASSPSPSDEARLRHSELLRGGWAMCAASPPTAIRRRWQSPLPASQLATNCLRDFHAPPLCAASDCPRGVHSSCARPALFCNTCPNASRRSDELLTWKDLVDRRPAHPAWNNHPHALEERAVARYGPCGCTAASACQDLFENQTRRKLNN